MVIPQRFSFIDTGDGTQTLYSEEYRESMHSDSGAYEEAFLKHVCASGILGYHRDVNVLDIGFGAGYNVLALLAESRRCGFNGFISILSVEKDPGFQSLLESMRFGDERDDLYGIIRMAIKKGMVSTPDFTLRIEWGDARNLVPYYEKEIFDAVFHDPFSPGKNPELWTVDFFKTVFSVMRREAVLTTYSSALQVRRALLDAGFMIGMGPPVGRKREGTLASKGAVLPPLDNVRIGEIMTNPRGTPYRDERLNGNREDILDRRLLEMSSRKGLQAR